MTNSGLHMGDVVDSIRRHKTVIFIVTVLAAITGAIFYIAGPKKYEGKSEFILRNPIYGDRSNIYSYDTKYLDYFANEDDIDKLVVMAESDMVHDRVIRNLDLAQVYKADPTDPIALDRMMKKFNKNFNITRTENKDMVLTYVDTDPARAAKVTNECVAVLDTAFGGYFREMRRNIYESVMKKGHEEDSTINALTDTLVSLRTEYGIHDIISPSRNNIMLSPMKENGHKDFDRGLELVQNIESVKDQLVGDRARQTTLINQYKTGNDDDQLPMLKVVTYAKTPVSPKGIGGMYTVLAAAFLGIFFSTMFMAFADKYFEKPAGK